MRRTYDLILGVGQACSCSQVLRAAGLQLLSFPFDWLILGSGENESGLDAYTQGVETDFKDWFRPEDFVYVGPSDRGHAIWKNARTGVEFRHDFDADADFAAELKKVEAKYRRRLKRMQDLCSRSRRLLLVRLDVPLAAMPRTSFDECRRVRKAFAKVFPNTAVDLLLFSYEPNIPFDAREIRECEPGFWQVAFDYQNKDPRMGDFHPDFKLLKRILAERFRVRDYRTAAERESHAQMRRADVSPISVLVPAFNHEKYVESCIRSVLEQDWPNVELLVVDDGSTDATWTKLQALRGECERKLAHVEMVTQENKGTSFTWSRLRSMAHGEFVLTLASDDELASGALSALVEPMLRNRKIGVVVGQNAFMDGEGRACYWNRALETVYDESKARYRSLNEAICEWAGVKQFSRQFGDYDRLLKDNYIANGCLIRASELAAVEFPAGKVPLEDYWVHLQLSKRTRYRAIREITFRYRWHAANTSHLHEKMREMTQHVYRFEQERLLATDDQKHLGVFRSVRRLQQGIPAPMGKTPYEIRKALLRVFGCGRKHRLFLSLGRNCEVAYRYFRRNGFCESGVFQWGAFATLRELVVALEHWESVFTGEVQGPDPLYRCANTGMSAHGKLPASTWADGVTEANQEIMEKDRADTVGRILHLKEKFPRQLQEGGCLLVCKIQLSCWFAEDCEELIRRLYATLLGFGARDFDLVLVLEDGCRMKKISLTGLSRTFVRFVSEFSPDDHAADDRMGDKYGWRLIFDEFAPRIVKKQVHKFKFEG